MLNGNGATLHKAKGVTLLLGKLHMNISYNWMKSRDHEEKCVISSYKAGMLNLPENWEIIWHNILTLLMRKPRPREFNFLCHCLPTI